MDNKTLTRYYQTTKHLKISQILYRIFYSSYRPSLSAPRSPALCSWLKPWQAPMVMPSPFLSSGELSFLGEIGTLDSPAIWNTPERSKLWLYNLHYFDAMNACDADVWQSQLDALVTRWIEENPPLLGNGWEPYPISLRLVNWIKWFSRYPNKLTAQCLDSFALQIQALLKQIEYHILGNHLFANAKALVFVGAYFSGDDAERWLSKGLQILDREITEQFLSDGGHFERSPMYHAIMLWDMCDLYCLAQCSGIESLLVRQQHWEEVILRGLSWLSAMTHPDGDIAFFNDASLGIAPRYEDILNYVRALGLGAPLVTDKTQLQLTQLPQSGYYVTSWPDNSKAILDVAPVGPDYQPGHAHADTLSFELSITGQRVFVNSGISQYGEGPIRLYERGTEAHNTVCVDGHNSSDVWGGFRVAERAYPFDIQLKELEDTFVITGSHDGYTRLNNGNIHTRQWSLSSNLMLIKDSISGQFTQAQARFYLHPDVSAHLEGNSALIVLPNGKKLTFSIDGKGLLSLQTTSWHATFGKSQPNVCLVVTFKGSELTSRIAW